MKIIFSEKQNTLLSEDENSENKENEANEDYVVPEVSIEDEVLGGQDLYCSM